MSVNILEKTKAKYQEYEDRHKQILKAAIRLFNENGYHTTTTASIAHQAGVHEATMYKHFTKKSELYTACFQSIADELFSKYNEVYKKNKDDVIAYITTVIQIYLDFVEKQPHKSMFLIHLLSNRNDPFFYEIYEDFMNKNIKTVERVLTPAFKKKGRLKSIGSNEIKFLSSLFVSQYLSIVATRDFVDFKSLKDHTVFNSIVGMLQLDGQ